MRTKLISAVSEHPVANLEGRDTTADRFDLSRKLVSQDLRLRPDNPVKNAAPLASEPLTWAAENAEVANLLMKGLPDRKPQSVRFTVVA